MNKSIKLIIVGLFILFVLLILSSSVIAENNKIKRKPQLSVFDDSLLSGDNVLNIIIWTIQELKEDFDALIGGNYTVKTKAVFDEDSIGGARISVNETEVEIIFEEEYPVAPIVTLTPIGLPNFFYGVDNITTRGFKILISEAQEKEIVFNWHAFAQELEEGINETINETNITIPSNLTDVNVSVNETVDVNITIPDEINQTIPSDSNESNNVTAPVNETEEVNQTIPEVNITVPENNNSETPINETSGNKTPPDDATSREEEPDSFEGQVPLPEIPETNETIEEEVVEEEPVVEEVYSSPITGAVVGANNQDNIISRFFGFIGGLFK